MNEQFYRSYGTFIGRVLMGLLFFFSGIGILMGGSENAAIFYTNIGIPMAGLVVWLVIALKVLGGGALIIGYKVRTAALALIVFTALATLLAHMDLEDINLFKNLAIIGGLLYVCAYGAGGGWRLFK